MAVKKLPNDVQCLFSASYQIYSFKRVIEELVYNSLDAQATSIAIRINIEENYIQVIDNGCGVSKADIRLIGKRYRTSKYVDGSTLKSAPDKYGFRGLSLASLVEVSKTVKITSRCESEEITFAKIFLNGIEQELCEVTTRPSKGTTVDVKGFLHNLNIQRKAVNALNELNRIKTFLEQISLIHNNLSLSLRDDSKNEILFKIHKKRDVYQTLLFLFNIERTDLQELQVEKNQYKVTGFIEKNGNKEFNDSHHWIYLNRRIVKNSRLHKIVTENFTKELRLNIQTKRNVKSMKRYNEEEDKFSKNIPTYFIFLICPYSDYDISCSSKQLALEFKNWDFIRTLLSKLVKLYVGDLKLKEIIKPPKESENMVKIKDTREQVKRIMEKILGNHTKKVCVSQMKNGIKGKPMKRRKKKEALKSHLKSSDKNIIEHTPLECQNNKITEAQNETSVKQDLLRENSGTKKIKTKDSCLSKKGKKSKSVISHRNTKSLKNKYKVPKLKHKDLILEKFLKGSNTVKQRCDMLARKAEDIIRHKNRERKIFSNKAIQYSKLLSSNKNISIRQKIDEIIIREYLPLPKANNKLHKNNVENKAIKQCVTSYDLVKPIHLSQIINDNVNTPNCIYSQEHRVDFQKNIFDSDNFQTQNKLTYESHECYIKELKSPNIEVAKRKCPNQKLSRKFQFITARSKDNFNISIGKLKSMPKNKIKLNKKKYTESKTKRQNLVEELMNKYEQFTKSSYTVDMFESNEIKVINKKIDDNTISKISSVANSQKNVDSNFYDDHLKSNFIIGGDTYTVVSDSYHVFDINSKSFENTKTVSSNTPQTYTIKENNGKIYDISLHSLQDIVSADDVDILQQNNDYNILSMSPHSEMNHDKTIDPLNVCEIVLNSSDIFQQDINKSTNENFINDTLCNNAFLLSFHSVIDKEAHQNITRNSCHAFSSSNNVINTSHHFNSEPNTITKNIVQYNDNEILIENICSNNMEEVNPIVASQHCKKSINREGSRSAFNFKDRQSFLPKGLSPIYENCRTKTNCDYYLDKSYFENEIYNNFVNDIQVNSEIYVPAIQNINDYATKNIETATTKFSKDKASIVFNGQSLKEAKVLGQVDRKFIAAKITGSCNLSVEESEYLVLFDQHAVHERIRLEKNLTDYLIDDQWTSVPLDGIKIKLRADDVLYLHNYKDKFTQLGLDWKVERNSEVRITAIPEAILGKNSRKVEKVIKSVRMLISEQINTIISQKGCISLYPKSIMELIFSEACRYAIKFGDKLTKNDCTELLSSLGDCKTPFQCAHGRPVMAVIIDIKSKEKEYKINKTKIQEFRNLKRQ